MRLVFYVRCTSLRMPTVADSEALGCRVYVVVGLLLYLRLCV